MKQPKVTIIILNWNGEKFLLKCFESIFKINYSNYSVIMVDNGSFDKSVQFIKDNFPQVELIENKKNLGFAAACNQGIKQALESGADYVLLLNNDTVVSSDFLIKMVRTGEQDRKIGIIGSKIYYFRNKSFSLPKTRFWRLTHRLRPREAGSYFENKKKIWFAGGKFIWWRVSGKHCFWQKIEKKELRGVRKSDFITGCAMLIKKQVFEDIGYLYEPYFLTVEDLDFCWRAKKKGWEIVVNLDAYLWHKVSASLQGEFSFFNSYYGTRNRLIFAFKRTNNFFGGIVLLFFVIPIRIFQWTLMGRFNMVKGLVFGVSDFFRKKMFKFK